MLLVVDDKVPDALALIRYYSLSLKDMAWKHTTYHIDKPAPSHMRLK